MLPKARAATGKLVQVRDWNLLTWQPWETYKDTRTGTKTATTQSYKQYTWGKYEAIRRGMPKSC